MLIAHLLGACPRVICVLVDIHFKSEAMALLSGSRHGTQAPVISVSACSCWSTQSVTVLRDWILLILSENITNDVLVISSVIYKKREAQ